MSRVIKFRAWRNEEMSKPFILGEGVCWPSGSVSTAGNLNVMQFTGLHDKNGVEIYECDVVVGDYSGEGPAVVSFNTQDIGSCGCCYTEFFGSGFAAFNHSKSAVMLDEDCEVIGNIYENPELLESES